jgi:hypothetical protein
MRRRRGGGSSGVRRRRKAQQAGALMLVSCGGCCFLLGFVDEAAAVYVQILRGLHGLEHRQALGARVYTPRERPARGAVTV